MKSIAQNNLKTITFKEGKYYICTNKNVEKTTDVGEFISLVFKNKNLKNNYGLNVDTNYSFCVDKIYHCINDNYIEDDNGHEVFFTSTALNGYEFEEIECFCSEAEKKIKELEAKNDKCRIHLHPRNKIGDVIYYVCIAILHGKKYSGYGVSISDNAFTALMLAYKTSRKNLLMQTELYKSLYGYGIY